MPQHREASGRELTTAVELSHGIIGNTMNVKPRIVLDTNVLVSALRSRAGASFELLSRLTEDVYELVISVPLMMEYESVLKRPGVVPIATVHVDAILEMICARATVQDIHFLWRPQLRDPKDEMVLEAAVNAGCDFLVTHNLHDFAAATRFEVSVVGPREFLGVLERKSAS